MSGGAYPPLTPSTGNATRSFLLFFAAFLASLMCLPATARAEVSAAEKAVAETLFDEGKTLMLEGDFRAACPKLEQSQAIESAIGTMLYLAECYEKTQRLASAWAMFREATSRANAEGQTERAKRGAERAEKLEPLLSKLTLSVASENTMQGFVITLDGNELPKTLHGTPVPIDTGAHVVSARAPEHETWTSQVTISGTAVSTTVDVPVLTKKASAPLPVVAPPADEPATPPSPALDDPTLDAQSTDRSSSGSAQRTWGLALGGVGLVGIGVGAYFGLEAQNTDDKAEELCPRESECNDQRALNLTEDAQDQALVANIGYGVGGAALLTGLILYFTAEDEDPVASNPDRSRTSGARPSTKLSASPLLSETFSGVSIKGAF